MKILMLNYEYPPIGGGAGKAHQNLIAEYANMSGLRVDVLTSSETVHNRIETVGDNITIHRLGIRKKNLHYWKKREVLQWLFKARAFYDKMVAENQYDLVHSFFAFPSGYLCLKTAGKLPYIISLRGSDVPGFNIRLKLDYHLLKGLFRRIWRKADAVIANSAGLAQLAKKFEPDLDIGVICNGVNTDQFAPPQERSLAGRIQLITVCRLISRKRIHLLIEALAIILKQGIDAELNIVGQGNLQTELETVAQTLGISDRVHFRGLVNYEQMPGEYRQNHLFIMSSAHEGMSNAMLEALACGLPVVTTACEGAGELIGDNGIAVDEADSNKIAAAIANIISHPAQYKQMSAASRAKAIQFSWALPAKKYVAIYQQIIENTKQKP